MTDGATVHCPACRAPVEADPAATAVACAHCGCAFSPWGLPTTEGEAPVSAPAAAEEGDDPLLGRVLGGRRLVRRIGRGGMGSVYEAHDARRGRVAVKVLPADLAADPRFVERFRREAAVLSSLSHPNLVEVLDRGEDDGRCWFAMEQVRGESLRRRMERGPTPWPEAVRVARGVLAGLGYAHGRGVVHRDLKPENVLLGDDGEARVVDFGLSRIVRGDGAEALSRLTRTNVVLGTYEYMAPEQRAGGAVDERADLWALGTILYEMLTGALPLGRFEPASALRPGVPASLDAVVHRALATAPKDRFPSAAAFREALDAAAAAGEAPVAAQAEPAFMAGAAGRWPAGREEAARAALRHVEILAASDRILGVASLLGFAGLLTVGRVVEVPAWQWFLPTVSAGSLLLLLAGIVLLRQAGRLDRLEPRARSWQVTLSVPLLVVLPPLGTVLGVWGLVTMTSAAARDAFALGRRRLLGPTPAFEASRAAGAARARPGDGPDAAPGPAGMFFTGLVLVGVGANLQWLAPGRGGFALFVPLLVLGAALAGIGAMRWLGFGRLVRMILLLAAVALAATVFLSAGRRVVPAPASTPRRVPATHGPGWPEPLPSPASEPRPPPRPEGPSTQPPRPDPAPDGQPVER